jgi:hypothetical protein
MKDRAHENLTELLKRFMDEPAAKTAHEDIQAGERWLRAYPAPRPDGRIVTAIKTRMAASAHRRRRITRLAHASLATAAAVIVVALIGLFDPGSASRSPMSIAGLIPAVIWDSDDMTADDLDLAYFSSQIGQIEAQMQAIEGGEGEIGAGAPEELEMELMAIQAEFLKG